MSAQFINWLKSPQGRAYFFSTHFWGPVANWGLPLAALADIQKDETMISGVMSPVMAGYSSIFMAFAWQVQPRNYLLFACHMTNAAAQAVQTSRFVNYWYMGGREKKLAAAPESAILNALDQAKDAAASGTATVGSAVSNEAAALNRAAQNEAAHLREQARVLSVKAQSEVAQLAEKTKSEAAALLARAQHIDYQGSLEAAKNHAAAGGEDALRRAKEIGIEAKRELGVAKDYVESKVGELTGEVVKEEKKAKGWFGWGK
ncbi:upf0041-domain-containing protein [Phaffia rhodozyma]|uniref:Mitochondrial pyruvate carrier n=1 Tax=Phaffia rhodozyma TaxID=264483 RepID=A0A0F7SFE7_PHARH|nr:upf0041-domain-containing protein [Phaffia rhodozyma]